MQTSRNLFRRHPFVCSFVVFVGLFFAFATWSELTAPPPKTLDYAKPIITGEGAIICPRSLLLDLRADHGPSAVFSVFTAISNRAEKVHALGCEEVRGGIPVTAHQMTEPFENYVSVSFNGGPLGALFTMGGELENLEGAVPSRTAESGGALAKATETARMEFQKSFASLDKPSPNLRWFEDQTESGADAQESATLVTPYGSCIELIGNTSAGYGLLFDGNYYHDPQGKGTFLDGTYQSRLAAIHAAEDYCHKWYISERDKPPNQARDSHIWFTPEDEPLPVSDQALAGSEESTLSSSLPAPIERQDPPPTVATNFVWATQPNGNDQLIGPKGACATLSGTTSNDLQGLRMTLSDGTTSVFQSGQKVAAMQAAEDYCRTQAP